MKALAILALLCVWATAPAAAQEQPDSAQTARMMELAQPGPEHERLAALEGEWQATYRMAGGITITGRVQNRMIMGGRFLESRVTGTGGGMPFESLHIMGFDRGPGVYTAVGFDTFGTFYVTAAGPWDPARNGAVLTGSYDDPLTGHAHEYEFIWTMRGPDRFTWDIVFLDDGARQTVMEGEYVRR